MEEEFCDCPHVMFDILVFFTLSCYISGARESTQRFLSSWSIMIHHCATKHVISIPTFQSLLEVVSNKHTRDNERIRIHTQRDLDYNPERDKVSNEVPRSHLPGSTLHQRHLPLWYHNTGHIVPVAAKGSYVPLIWVAHTTLCLLWVMLSLRVSHPSDHWSRVTKEQHCHWK